MSSCTLDWVGTQLTYVAASARGSPFVNIMIFKHNENKLRHLYTFNMMPSLENVGEPWTNSEQTYTGFPYEVKLSIDGVFLAVTMFDGSINLMKMPDILNPLEEDKPKDNIAEATGSAQNSSSRLAVQPPGSQGGDEPAGPMIKSDLERYLSETIELSKVLIQHIPVKPKKEFVDPFTYNESEEGMPSTSQMKS